MTSKQDFTRRPGERGGEYTKRVAQQNIQARRKIAERRRRETRPREATLASLKFPTPQEEQLAKSFEQGGLSPEQAATEAKRIVSGLPAPAGAKRAGRIRQFAAKAETPRERADAIARAEALEGQIAGVGGGAVTQAQARIKKEKAKAEAQQKKTQTAIAERATKQAGKSAELAADLAREAKASPIKESVIKTVPDLRRSTAQRKLRKEGFGVGDGFNLDLAVQFARSPNNERGITRQMLEDAGFTSNQIKDAEKRTPTQATLSGRAFAAETRAKQVTALQKISKYKEGTNRYDISKALADGVRAKTLEEARFSTSDIREAVKINNQVKQSALTTSERAALLGAGLTTKEIGTLSLIKSEIKDNTLALGAGALGLVTSPTGRAVGVSTVGAGGGMAASGGGRLLLAAALLTGLAIVAKAGFDAKKRSRSQNQLLRNYQTATSGQPKDATLPPGIKASLVAAPRLRPGTPPLVPVKPPPLPTTFPRDDAKGGSGALPGFDISKAQVGDRILTAATAELAPGVKEEPKTDELTAGLNKKYREQLEALLKGAAAGIALKQQTGAQRYRTTQELRRRALEEARKVYVASGGASQLPRSANVQAIAAAILGQAAIILKAQAAQATRASTAPVIISRGTIALRVPKAGVTPATTKVTKPATAANITAAKKATRTTTTATKAAAKTAVRTAATTAATTATTTTAQPAVRALQEPLVPPVTTAAKPTPTTAAISRTATRPRTATAPKVPPIPPPFRLPGGGSLAKGVYPREVTWLQGFTRITVDLDTGRRQTRHVDSPGVPRGTFIVTRTDKSPPKAQIFDLGVDNIVVTGRVIRFRLERRKTRSGMPKPRMGRR